MLFTGEKHPGGGICSIQRKSIQQVGAFVALYWGEVSSRLRHETVLGRSIQKVGAYVLLFWRVA